MPCAEIFGSERSRSRRARMDDIAPPYRKGAARYLRTSRFETLSLPFGAGYEQIEIIMPARVKLRQIFMYGKNLPKF